MRRIERRQHELHQQVWQPLLQQLAAMLQWDLRAERGDLLWRRLLRERQELLQQQLHSGRDDLLRHGVLHCGHHLQQREVLPRGAADQRPRRLLSLELAELRQLFRPGEAQLLRQRRVLRRRRALLLL